MGGESKLSKQERTRKLCLEGTWNPKKRSSLGKTCQAMNKENTQPTKENYESIKTELKVLYSNVDQLTSIKKTELINRVKDHKPLVLAICELKPKNGSSRQDLTSYSDFPNWTSV